MKRFYPVVSIILTILLAGFLYRDSFRGYFFQDDWFSFQISKVENIQDILNFFIPRTDVIYYRPLGMQIPFFLMQKIFGINPFPYHMLIFLTHSLNIILVYKLIKLLSKNTFSGLLSAFLYGTSTVHYIPFYWFATYAFILGPTFFLSSFFYFLKAQKMNIYYSISLVLFLFGLLTNEIVATLPIILFLYLFTFKRDKLIFVLPYFFFSAFLFLIRFVFFPPVAGEAYSIDFGRGVIQNLKMYLLWSANWSEPITEQLVKLFVFQKEFVAEFRGVTIVTLTTFFIHISIILVSIIFAIKTRMKNMDKVLLFGICWYLVSLTPVLFFPTHRFAYYLPVAMVGFLLVICNYLFSLLKTLNLLNPIASYVLVGFVCLNWIVAAYTTIEFNRIAHWAPRRAAIAKEIVQKVKLKYPALVEGQFTFYIRPTSENKLALNDKDGLQIIFDNPLIQTVYGYQEGKETL